MHKNRKNICRLVVFSCLKKQSLSKATSWACSSFSLLPYPRSLALLSALLSLRSLSLFLSVLLSAFASPLLSAYILLIMSSACLMSPIRTAFAITTTTPVQSISRPTTLSLMSSRKRRRSDAALISPIRITHTYDGSLPTPTLQDPAYASSCHAGGLAPPVKHRLTAFSPTQVHLEAMQYVQRVGRRRGCAHIFDLAVQSLTSSP